MSKKQFTANLEDLLDTPAQGETASTAANTAAQPMPARPKSAKGFVAHIDALFQETEAAGSTESEVQKTPTVISKQDTLPLRGLDALIRRTDTGEETGAQAFTTKRITVSLDITKVDSLKRLATSRKMYMRDIISLALTRYLDEVGG